MKVVKRNGGKVAKRSFISGSESESELDSVVGGEEASIETEVLVARRKGGKEASSETEALVARRQGGKEASSEIEALVARRQGGKEAGGKGSVGGERKCCTLVARCSHDFLT